MKNGLFTIDKSNVLSALTYGALAALAVFGASVGTEILQHGSIFGLDWHSIIDHGVIALIGLSMVGLSLLKNFLTDNKGKFLSLFTVIPDKTDSTPTT